MKKPILFFITFFTLILLVGCTNIKVNVWTSDGFGLMKYNHEYYIIKYRDNATEIAIPNEYKGVAIVGLGFKQMSFTLPDSVIKLTISKNIKNIDNDYILANKLEEIDVNNENNYYKSIDGVLFSKDGKTLLEYPNDKKGKDYIVPNGVEKLLLIKMVTLENLYIQEDYLVNLLSRCDSLVHIFVPASLLTTYKENTYWKYYADKIEAIPSNEFH